MEEAVDEKTKLQRSLKIVLYIILIVYADATVYPFVWAIAASFMPLKEIVSVEMSILTMNFSLNNYNYIFSRSSLFGQWFINSVIVSVIGTTINVLFEYDGQVTHLLV
jgi:multiple sugar transport system permease protein